ncbi:MAG: hypothetical protein SFY66_27710 [Oculatellaceae cyanobacterium bins.114]|nr:hypothetical protein [Oculatellaceae cyanobacterium bins.114]
MIRSTLFDHVVSQVAPQVVLVAGAIASSLVIASASALPASELSVPSAITPSPAMQLSDARISTADVAEPDVAENRFMVLAIALGGCVGVCLVVNALVGQKQSWFSQKPTGVQGRSQSSSNTPNWNQANPSLQRKLMRLLHGDQAAAQRLFKLATLKYPGENANWYIEKVIYDLERDRRGI